MKLIERNIPPNGLHIIAYISVGEKDYPMVLDTGASKTIFDLDFYRDHFGEDSIIKNEESSFSIEGEIGESFTAPISQIVLDGIPISDENIVLIKLDEVNYVYTELGHEPIIGILGSDWLKRYAAIINYSTMQFSLNPKSE